MLDEGADIIDVGGESTRPGKKEPVTAEQEIDRVLPVIEGIRKTRPHAIISVDTYRSGTALAAIEARAKTITDPQLRDSFAQRGKDHAALRALLEELR